MTITVDAVPTTPEMWAALRALVGETLKAATVTLLTQEHDEVLMTTYIMPKVDEELK